MRSQIAILLSLHFLIVGIAVPSIGCAVYTFAACDWTRLGLFSLTRLFGSVAGGLILQIFIWPFTFSLALITIGLCYLLYKKKVTNLAVWFFGGSLIGIGFSMYFAVLWVHAFEFLLSVTGAILGASAGIMLNYLWCRDNETAPGPFSEDR